LLKTQLQPPLLPICPENYIIPKGYNWWIELQANGMNYMGQ
jgi:hypothetical protein